MTMVDARRSWSRCPPRRNSCALKSAVAASPPKRWIECLQRGTALSTQVDTRLGATQELRRVMDAKLDTTHGYFVQPIGLVRSCFKTCLGTVLPYIAWQLA